MATNHFKMVTYLEGLPSIKLLDPLGGVVLRDHVTN